MQLGVRNTLARFSEIRRFDYQKALDFTLSRITVLWNHHKHVMHTPYKEERCLYNEEVLGVLRSSEGASKPQYLRSFFSGIDKFQKDKEESKYQKYINRRIFEVWVLKCLKDVIVAGKILLSR